MNGLVHFLSVCKCMACMSRNFKGCMKAFSVHGGWFYYGGNYEC